MSDHRQMQRNMCVKSTSGSQTTKMNKFSRKILLCLSLLLVSGPTYAQWISTVTSETARRAGLEPIWQAALAADDSSHVSHVTMHVSSQSTFTAFQVSDATGRRFYYSERDLNRFGLPIGVDEARRLADIKVLELNARRRNPTLETKTVAEVTLYVQTSDGNLQAIDGETGRTLWSTQLGKPHYPTVAGVANDQFVAATSGSSLYVVDSVTGRVLTKSFLHSVPSAAMTIFGDSVYLPNVLGKIDTYDLRSPRRLSASVGSAGAVHTRPCVTPNSISWTTEAGDLFVADVRTAGLRFRFSAQDAVYSAPAFVAPHSLLLTSVDGFIYSLNEQTGDVPWRVSTGDSISQTPLVADDTAYIATDPGQLYSLDAISGDVRWAVPGMERVISVSSERVFALGQGSRLWALDRGSGQPLGGMNVAGADLFVVNEISDRIYLGNSRGVLQAFREIGQQYPTIRQPVRNAAVEPPAPGKEVGKKVPELSPGESPPPTRPADDRNPFGDDQESNPFGAANAADPLPKAAADAQPEQPAADQEPESTDDENPFDFGGDNPFADF